MFTKIWKINKLTQLKWPNYKKPNLPKWDESGIKLNSKKFHISGSPNDIIPFPSIFVPFPSKEKVLARLVSLYYCSRSSRHRSHQCHGKSWQFSRHDQLFFSRKITSLDWPDIFFSRILFGHCYCMRRGSGTLGVIRETVGLNPITPDKDTFFYHRDI